MFGKKKAKLFGGEIEPDCSYCVHSSEEGCTAGENHPCARFAYDPLKRTPHSLPGLKKHDPDDFKL